MRKMSPKRKGKIFLESPNVFKLKYIFKSGGQHPFLNKIKLCALTSFNVQYTPDGSYMTYDDGSMTSYNVSMSFGELNPIYEDEIDEDGEEHHEGLEDDHDDEADQKKEKEHEEEKQREIIALLILEMKKRRRVAARKTPAIIR